MPRLNGDAEVLTDARSQFVTWRSKSAATRDVE
jgi:hypothetical protein